MWTCMCLVKRMRTTLLQLIWFKTWARGRTHLRNQLWTDNVEGFLPCLPSSICLVGIITGTFDMTKLSPAMGHRYCAEKARAFMTGGFDDCFFTKIRVYIIYLFVVYYNLISDGTIRIWCLVHINQVFFIFFIFDFYYAIAIQSH